MYKWLEDGFQEVKRTFELLFLVTPLHCEVQRLGG